MFLSPTKWLLLCLLLPLLPAHGATPDTANSMRDAAMAFLDSLEPDQRESVTAGMDHPSRVEWTYLPGKRKGLPFKAMNSTQREKAQALMRSALSAEGFDKAETIMQLEQVLRELTGQQHRDPGLYYFAIHGEPEAGKAWSWRVAGHHLALHFTISPEGEVSVTPSFWGANPARVPSGELEGTRALGEEEDLGRALVLSLADSQQQVAILSDRAPGDIVTRSKSQIDRMDPEGIAYGDLDATQQKQLVALVRLYLQRFARELAAEDWDRIAGENLADLHFAWAGSLEPDQRHYYRIQGDTFLIEFDKVGRDANHTHSVLRFFDRDFGYDFLKEHYEADAHE